MSDMAENPAKELQELEVGSARAMEDFFPAFKLRTHQN